LEEIGVDYAQGFAIARPQPYITPHQFDAHNLELQQTLAALARV